MAITAQPAELCKSRMGNNWNASKPQTKTCGQLDKGSGRGHRLRPSFWRSLSVEAEWIWKPEQKRWKTSPTRCRCCLTPLSPYSGIFYV